MCFSEQYLPFFRTIADAFYRKNQWYLDREEVIQEAMLALVKAEKTYDSSVCTFLTYAKRVVSNHLYDYAKKQGHRASLSAFSLDNKEHAYTLFHLSHELEFAQNVLEDVFLADERDYEEIVVCYHFASDFLRSLTPLERYLIFLRLEGKLQSECAKLLHERTGEKFYQVKINRMLEKIGEKYLAFQKVA